MSLLTTLSPMMSVLDVRMEDSWLARTASSGGSASRMALRSGSRMDGSRCGRLAAGATVHDPREEVRVSVCARKASRDAVAAVRSGIAGRISNSTHRTKPYQVKTRINGPASETAGNLSQTHFFPTTRTL